MIFTRTSTKRIHTFQKKRDYLLPGIICTIIQILFCVAAVLFSTFAFAGIKIGLIETADTLIWSAGNAFVYIAPALIAYIGELNYILFFRLLEL